MLIGIKGGYFRQSAGYVLVFVEIVLLDAIFKFKPRKWIPLCFAEPENAFEVQN